MTNIVQNFADEFEDLKIPLNGVRLPTFEISDKYRAQYNLSPTATNAEFLRELCLDGFKRLNLEKNTEEYRKYTERVKYELETINELVFTDYLLLVWSVIKFCEENKIPTGRGRGSAAGSLVLYLINVTKIDPIEHGLYFERFISKTRAKKQIIDGVTYLDGSLMVDVDLDFDFVRRKEVIDYINNKFPGRTAKILTFNTLSGKLLIKECGKIVGEKTETEMNEVSAMIPKKFGKVRDIQETHDGILEKDGTVKEDAIKEFVNWCAENPDIYNISLKLRGLIKNKGVHASGLLISHDPLEESCPIEFSADKEPVSGFDMNWVSLINVKLDCLGLRSVSVVDDVCKNLGIKEEDIDINDPFIYQNLYDLKTPHGIFQIEADTNCGVTQKVKPKNFGHVTAILAIARPGALQFADTYAKFCETGELDFESTGSEKLDKILRETGGCVIYQETLMRIAHEVFELSLEQAELIRRATGKKKLEEMEKFESLIQEQAKKLNIEKAGEFYWKCLLDSADYSFNKSHAAAYASLSATTTYLKFKYPKQFFLSLLRMTRHEPDPTSEIAKIHRELPHFGIKLLPPHLLKSDLDFTVEGENIRFGLLSIKGIGDKVIERLNQFRRPYMNKFEVFQGAEDAGLSIGVTSALTQAGSLEGFSQSRTRIVLEAQLWHILTNREKEFAFKLAEENQFNLIAILKKLPEFKDEKGKVVIKESRMNTIRKHYQPYKEIYDLNSKNEDFANWFYENRLLGYSAQNRLSAIFAQKEPDLESINDVSNTPVGNEVCFIGVVKEAKESVSKKKTPYFRMLIADEFNTITVLMFDNARFPSIKECRALNGGKLPEEDNIVIVKGTKKEDAVFARLAATQDQKIYTKLSELKSLKKKEEKALEISEKKTENTNI